ncbi:helix-turn-helix transcriptional regulator [Paenibacillus arenilitoris]|uniref:YafY family transcriptional regulator n=1 Tax=Paenibacillus arenilitoris TaxID=2772299 RepID=A0A927CPB2_9BACL|nr:YafY family protein [Paenibacillus arenilitoris]MBD2869245.1 YafY family transcriptional regulator [Paenibacillus arenilitoris]
MSKSKRLLELMMTVNRKRRFTVKELAREFGVSARTILRDLQELGELGVPLYSEVGPHGGYQVLNERILPPIAFTEEEAVSIFFASHALRHYASLPFESEASSAMDKFYRYMSGDVRDRIDQMKNRVDFVTPARHSASPYLTVLLNAAIGQKVVLAEYESRGGSGTRHMQPIGIYASSGLWYCPAYCFERGAIRLFRCDRIRSAAYDDSGVEPKDLRDVHLGNLNSFFKADRKEGARLRAELSKEGVQRCEAELWAAAMLHVREDGSGRLEGGLAESDLAYFAKFFIGLGHEASVSEPPELISTMKRLLAELAAKYGLPE